MKELIEALKNNEKPFGLMSGAMQAKAKEIGDRDSFELYTDCGWGPCVTGLRDVVLGVFDHTYRLRPDYEPVEDEYVMLTTADFEELERAEEIIANAVGCMCDTIRKQHDELVRRSK